MQLVVKIWKWALKVWAWLQGKKTYLAALALALNAIIISGIDQGDWETARVQLLEAAAVAGLRQGVSKVQ